GDQGVVDLAGQIALDAAHDLGFGQAFLAPSVDIGAGTGTKPHPDPDGQVQGPVGVAVPAAVQPVAVGLAGAGGDGGDPHRWAKAASPRSRSGCWPAVTSSWPAWAWPIARSPSSRGAARPTSVASRWSARPISASSSWMRRAIACSAALLACTGS